MVEAFMYMYVVGAGTAFGVATVVFVSWKVYQRSAKGSNPMKKKRKVGQF